MTQKKLNIPKNDTYDKTISIKVTRTTEKELHNLAKLNNCTISDIVRFSITKLLDNIVYP